MSKLSAGLLMYRIKNNRLEVFLVHPGGPFWKNKDSAAWSIPKGEIKQGENLIAAAKREFEEETGIKANGNFIPLGTVKRPGKIVHAWAFEGEWNGFLMKQQMIEINFKGKKIKVPEIDNLGFFPLEKAREKIVAYQKDFLERLEKLLN